jgi:hypothetical protein
MPGVVFQRSDILQATVVKWRAMKRLLAVAAATLVLGSTAARAGAQTSTPTPAKPPASQAKPAAPKPAATTKMPAAIDAAFKKAYPNATVKNVAKETEDGKVQYEVESVDAGRRRDINYNPDGTVILYEEELTEADVPAVVVSAIKTRYPKATITTRERLYTMADKSANYEFILKGAGVSEVILTPDGKWVSPKAPVKK